ncbi:hypothetical protein DFO73_10659 [Cytobacillus oceanisediminis]|uniref:Polysaccharide deacetylase n=1 Tax=Cytobacillus oceanisediminis TaxID=665099 RepID=A0A2V3A3Y2_9BACI|nr:hypothetical protein [Cytobacillus oceanisediminis]PWW28244.1 hypothetical protein DFO73_10659 [Cytobacillus oceanisediminis]
MSIAKVGIYFDKKTAERRWEEGLNVFEVYVKQMVEYIGIPFDWIETHNGIKEHDILIIALESAEESFHEKLWNYVNEGGIIIAYGGLDFFANSLGQQTKGIGTGYALNILDYPLRFLQGICWNPQNSGAKGCIEKGFITKESPDSAIQGSLLQRFSVGKGEIHRWSVDIIGTIVGLQQGTKGVEQDGIPAPDGSANLDDNLLKADDGFEMHWEHDRQLTETGEPFFAYPYADDWKEVMISHLVQTALEKDLVLPFIDYWPDEIDQIAMISHDSDLNIDQSAQITLDLLDQCDVKTTWCMMEPGFHPDYYEKMLKSGHEIAFHYNALESDNGHWSGEEFNRQLNWLKKAAGLPKITSNKNHYTLFENWGQLFQWCEKYGIESDQTRGPSKKGNIGFLFGTCHPYFPIAWEDEKNRFYNVVEISFLTQDLGLDRLVDTSVIRPFLSSVQKVRGVAHFLFHQVHLYRQASVREAFVKVVEEAKRFGYVFWTGKQINDWVRLKKEMRITGIDEDGTILLRNGVYRSVVLVPVLDGKEEPGLVRRFGVWCRKHVYQQKHFDNESREEDILHVHERG